MPLENVSTLAPACPVSPTVDSAPDICVSHAELGSPARRQCNASTSDARSQPW